MIDEELIKNQRETNDGVSFSLKDEDNYDILEGYIEAQQGSVYEGNIYMITITVPPDYPDRIPQFKFMMAIYHPNISESGELKISSSLGERRILPLLEYIRNLLSVPDLKNIACNSAAELFRSNRLEFNKKASSWGKD